MSDYIAERQTVRELAKQVYDIAVSDRYIDMRRRFKATNDLQLVRPPLIIEELPRHEMNVDGLLDCRCETDWIRSVEFELRLALLRHKLFKCDNYIEPVWKVQKSFSVSDDGLHVDENQLAVDDRNNIVSHHYNDILADEDSFDRMFRPQRVTAHPEQDAENVARLTDLFGETMPVQLIGIMTYYAPWDTIPRLRGVEPILDDMYDRPEYLHHIIGRMTENARSVLTQQRELGLFGSEAASIHCTPADITYKDDGKIHCWFRTMAQMFNIVSPKLHYEYDMAYSIPLAEDFSYTYYGCCEPLDDRLDYVFRYKNLRKVGCTPWAKVQRMAEGLGKNYVLSRKPNPANVAMVTDPEVVRREITETVEACQRNGTPCEFILKDISTVSYKPENLVVWAQVASEVLDRLY